MLPKVFSSPVDMLRAATRDAPDREAVVMDDERMSYRQFGSCVATVATRLPGDQRRTALLMRNSIDMCVAMFAVHAAGGQVVPLNPAYTAAELAPILADADVDAVIADADVADRLDGLVANAPIVVDLTRPETRLTRPPAISVRLVDLPLPDPAWIATLQYTGGTTGRAKGVELSHRAIAINIAQREALLPTGGSDDRILCVMPLFHCYAVHMGLHGAVYRQAALILDRSYHPGRTLDLIERERISFLAGSPTLFTGLMSYDGFDQADLSSLRVASSGSAALPAEMLRRWEAATGVPIIEGYGQTEAGPVVTFNPVAGMRKPGSVGVAVPATEIDIVESAASIDGAIGRCGEIRVRGPQIMTGYRNRPEENRTALRDGWLYTGDLGEMDQDGYLYIRGRAKEMIIVSGFNVFPREIEDVLNGFPGVAVAAVIGRAHSYRGEVPIAFVVPDRGASPTETMLIEHCRGRLAAYKLPVEVHFLDDMPKTQAGKIDKIALAALPVSERPTV